MGIPFKSTSSIADKKKIAFKEEAAKAKNFLEGLKSKYYDEIKLRPGVTQEQKKAVDFFNRYNQEQEAVKQKHERFFLTRVLLCRTHGLRG